MNNTQLLEVPRLQVTSSHIKSIGYDIESRTLVTEFNNGAIWAYSPITQAGFTELQEAESKGTYFNDKIKSNTSVTSVCLQKKA